VIVLNFEVKFFGCCSIAFAVQSSFVALSWHTHRLLYHSKWTKIGKDIRFQTKEGLELFLEKIATKYHNLLPTLLAFFFPCSFTFNALTTFVVF